MILAFACEDGEMHTRSNINGRGGAGAGYGLALIQNPSNRP